VGRAQNYYTDHCHIGDYLYLMMTSSSDFNMINPGINLRFVNYEIVSNFLHGSQYHEPCKSIRITTTSIKKFVIAISFKSFKMASFLFDENNKRDYYFIGFILI
jgi:hypothetical protein